MDNPIETKKKQQLLLVMVFLKDPHVERDMSYILGRKGGLN